MQSDIFNCEHCGNLFNRREHYQRHLLTHTKERPFSCTECGHSFARVDALTRHSALVHTQGHVEGSGERRRVAQACKPCNLAKLRCDGQRPCDRCRRYGDECHFEERQKRRTLGRTSSFSLPRAKRPQAQAPCISNEIPPRLPRQGGNFQNPSPCAPSVIGNESITPGGVEPYTPSQGSADLPDLNGFFVGGPDQIAAQAAAPSYQRPLDPRAPNWESLLGVEDLNIGADLDASIWSDILNSQSAIDRFDNIWLSSTQPPMVQDVEANPSQMPTPLTPAALAEIYNRGCSPGPSDQEAIEPRQYHPTAIDVDAQLTFPDLRQTSTEQIDQEDLAHVQETQQTVVDEVAKLAANLASNSLFPPFKELEIPPAPILNAWTQLYFEHFHPVFPILHPASFGYPDTHWLLVFTVSAIGAQFSQIPRAPTCSRAMHEMIRRQSMFLCETQNKNGRELWLTQVILLNHIGLRYSGERRALEIAEILQALPVTLARRKQLFTDILSAKKLTELDLSLRQRWQIWTLDEERRRTGFAIWLVDSGFQCHFDLTPVLWVGELTNSLPRREDPWSASSAGGWASYSTHPDPESQVTLQQVLANNSWVTAWNGTGVLGKQALLQLLMNVVSNDARHLSFSQAQYTLSPQAAEELLKGFLASLEDEELGISATERKACGAYRLMILSALMSRNTPQFSLLATAMRIRYQRCSEKEFSEMTSEWRKAPQERRRAALYAARIIESVRGQYCAHFSTPVLLFRATLTLWLYTILDPLPSDQHTAASPTVILGGSRMNDSVQKQWVETGTGRVKLQGVGNIFTPNGRGRLLDESISVMHTIHSWGISKIYEQLLSQLR